MEPKFVYNQEVLITKGFYRGHKGIVKKHNIVESLFYKTIKYEVQFMLSGNCEWHWFTEEQLENGN